MKGPKNEPRPSPQALRAAGWPGSPVRVVVVVVGSLVAASGLLAGAALGNDPVKARVEVRGGPGAFVENERLAEAAADNAPVAGPDSGAGGGSGVGAESAASAPRASGEEPVSPSEPSLEGREAATKQAAEDLDRGRQLLAAKGKGTKGVQGAFAAFSAAVDRLRPLADSLEPDGRWLLLRALDERARCALLLGKRSGAKEDLGSLVSLDPSYAPDPEGAPKKFMDLFNEVRAARVAFVSLRVDPAGTHIEWNGRPLALARGKGSAPGSAVSPAAGSPAGSAASPAAGGTPVLAGPFVLRAHFDCFEERRIEGTLQAGEQRALSVKLDPLGREIRIETVPPNFDLEWDGTAVGRTTMPAEPPSEGKPLAGALTLPCVPAGTHTYLLKQDCYAEARGSIAVEVDFLDPSPMVLPTIMPARQVASLSLESDVPGAQVFIDGRPVGATPIKDLQLCPARKRIEVRSGGRVPWSDDLQIEDGPLRIVARRRPTLRAVIAESVDRSERIDKGQSPTEGTPAGALHALSSWLRGRISSFEGFNRAEPAGPESDRDLLHAIEQAEARGEDQRLHPPGALESSRALGAVPPISHASDQPLPAVRDKDPFPAAVPRPPAGAGDPTGRRRILFGADLLLIVDSKVTGRGAAMRLRLLAALPGFDETVLCLEGDRACMDRFFEGLELPWPRVSPYTGLALAGSHEGVGLTVLAANGPAKGAGLREGDRILTAGSDRPLATKAEFRSAIESALAGSSAAVIELGVERKGERIVARLPVRQTTVIAAPGSSLLPAARIAAAAELDIAVMPEGEVRNAAMMNLASLLLARGDHAGALAFSLGKQGWAGGIDGPASAGTAKFLAALCHETLGEREQAAALFGAASNDAAATLWEPDGLPVSALATLMEKSMRSAEPAAPIRRERPDEAKAPR